MVLAKVATEIIKRGITHGSRIARYDKAAWNKLYTGFPKYVKKGTREGFIVGSTLGSLIQGTIDLSNQGQQDTGTNPDGIPQKTKFRKRSPQLQAYRRQSRKSKCRCRKRYPNRYYSR